MIRESCSGGAELTTSAAERPLPLIRISSGPSFRKEKPRSGASSYELHLPSDLVPTTAGITRAGVIVARPRDELFVAGRRTTARGTCGVLVFVVTQLVSVLPAR